MAYRIGVDVGGTFTDLVLVGPNGRLVLDKHPTTPRDQSVGPSVTQASPYLAASAIPLGAEVAMASGRRGRCTQPGIILASSAV